MGVGVGGGGIFRLHNIEPVSYFRSRPVFMKMQFPFTFLPTADGLGSLALLGTKRKYDDHTLSMYSVPFLNTFPSFDNLAT